MATSRSFLTTFGGPPPRYQTPSPPRHAVEPISPHAQNNPYNLWNEDNGNKIVDGFELNEKVWNGNNVLAGVGEDTVHSPMKGNSNVGRAAAHSRAGSTIDTLATIALATSPTFAPAQSYADYVNPPPSLPPHGVAYNESHERPSKRARSEKLPSPTWQRTESRPATSHISSFESMKFDAELLLNFAKPSNFPPLPHAPNTQDSPYLRIYPNHEAGAWVSETDSLHNNLQYDPLMNGPPSPPNDFGPTRIRSTSDARLVIEKTVGSDSSSIGNVPTTGSTSSAAQLLQTPGPELAAEGRSDYIFQHQESSGDNAGNKMKPDSTESSGSLQSETEDSSVHLSVAELKEDTPPTRAKPSAQATCAGCNLTRITVDGEDQNAATSWISCDGCKRWFHFACAGFKDEREVRSVDRFSCRECRPTHGPTTFVRKSSRARTAIDYAGLNQGVVKSSTDNPEHHYIKPIKEGKIKFLPETFPRIRPELVTAEYFERGSGMMEPIVIPASLNPRPSETPSGNTSSVDDPFTWDARSKMKSDLDVDGLDLTEYEYEVVPDSGQDALDMVIPQHLTVRTVAELYGPEEKVEVIDVKSQQGEDRKWNMRRWADYYESTDSKVVRNVISLEVSQSKLGRLIRRPRIVRELDLQDSVWPADLKAIGDYPKVQFYCLMSVADCFTDFHIDFGGSSVFYTILKGKKTFFFIPPKDKHLKKYEEWCMSPAQDTTFLGDQTKECYRVDLSEGDTMLIPAGWIHAVWTPENSLVIGGNFLTRLHYEMQIKVAKIEKDTKVARKFRYPYFQKILWYTALKYLEEDPLPQSVVDAFHEDETFQFYRKHPVYYEFGERENNALPDSEYFNARFYSQSELEGLPELARYLLRTALIAGGHIVDGITLDARNAVKKSIPKGHGEPLEIVKKFGMWLAWKRGNERAAHWTQPNKIPVDAKTDLSKPSARATKKFDAIRTAPERQSSRVQSLIQAEALNGLPSATVSTSPGVGTPFQRKRNPSISSLDDEDKRKPRSTPKTSGLGPKRVACDACRKRRIRCRHKDEQNEKQFTTDSEILRLKPGNAHGANQGIGPLPNEEDPSQLNGRGLTHELDIEMPSYDSKHAPVVDSSTTKASRDQLGPSTPLGPSQALANKAHELYLPGSGSSSKKGRSKACEECRKSKRRCIHDEYGRIDPIKAQEPSKPRAAGSAKRPRTSDEGIHGPVLKRSREALEGQDELNETISIGDSRPSFIDPALFTSQPAPSEDFLARKSQREDSHNDGDPITTTITSVDSTTQVSGGDVVPSTETEQSKQLVQTQDVTIREAPTEKPLQVQAAPADNEVESIQSSYASPPEQKVEPSETSGISTGVSFAPPPPGSLASPPNSLLNDAAVSPAATEGDITITIETGGPEPEHSNPLHTPKSTSRHSSRQPKQVQRPVPETSSAETKPAKAASPPKAMSSSSRRASSSTTTGAVNGKTSASRRASSQTSPALTNGAKSGSPTDRKASSSSVGLKRERTGFGEIEADEESLRLIRELQEQDFGLRRRGRVN